MVGRTGSRSGWVLLSLGVLLAALVASGGGAGGVAGDVGSQLWVPLSDSGQGAVLASVARVNAGSGLLESDPVDVGRGCRLVVAESGVGVVLTAGGPVVLDGVSLEGMPLDAPGDRLCGDGEADVFLGDGVGWVVRADGSVVRFDLDGSWIDEDWTDTGQSGASVTVAPDGLALLMASRRGVTRVEGTEPDRPAESRDCGNPLSGVAPKWGRAGEAVVAIIQATDEVWRLDGPCDLSRVGVFHELDGSGAVGSVVRSPELPVVAVSRRGNQGRIGLAWVNVDTSASGTVDFGESGYFGPGECVTAPVVSGSRAWVVAPQLNGGTAFGVDLANPSAPPLKREGLGLSDEGCGNGPGDVFVAAGPEGGLVVTSARASSVWTYRSAGQGWFEAEKPERGTAPGEEDSSTTTVPPDEGDDRDDPDVIADAPPVVLPETVKRPSDLAPGPGEADPVGGTPTGSTIPTRPPASVDPPKAGTSSTTAPPRTTTTTTPATTNTTTPPPTTDPPPPTTTTPVGYQAKWEACRTQHQTQIPPEECDYIVDFLSPICYLWVGHLCLANSYPARPVSGTRGLHGRLRL